MSQASADIVGSAGANFVATVDSGKIVSADLRIVGQPVVPLAVGADARSVTVPSLPAGDSTIALAIIFGPGEPNANIGVGSGTPKAAVPPGIILDNNQTGFIGLFGV